MDEQRGVERREEEQESRGCRKRRRADEWDFHLVFWLNVTPPVFLFFRPFLSLKSSCHLGDHKTLSLSYPFPPPPSLFLRSASMYPFCKNTHTRTLVHASFSGRAVLPSPTLLLACSRLPLEANSIKNVFYAKRPKNRLRSAP